MVFLRGDMMFCHGTVGHTDIWSRQVFLESYLRINTFQKHL